MTHPLDYSPYAEESRLARLIKSTIAWGIIVLNCISIALPAAIFIGNFQKYLHRQGLYWLGATWRGESILVLIVQAVFSLLPTLLIFIPGLTSRRRRWLVILLFAIGIAITILNFIFIDATGLPEPAQGSNVD